MPDRRHELERGRQAYAKRSWKEAHAALSRAGEEDALEAADLELLATAAYMLGRGDDVRNLERAHDRYAAAGEVRRAARCAVWIGLYLSTRGELGPATGWFGRAQRLLEREEGDCAEAGYLLFPPMFRCEAAGDFEGAAALAAKAAEIGDRFGDEDLFALATHAHGLMLVKLGRVLDGLRLLDEAMVAVTAGKLSPVVSGLVYCGVILACQDAYELRRAREWTAALTRWCDEQPDLVSFTGACLLHRAELMQLHGTWPESFKEAARAGERSAQAGNHRVAAAARYRQGEVLRLQGDLTAAEEAYRDSSRGGFEPQPGLALLRLAQGRGELAAAAIRRALGETSARTERTRLLPACVEIMLAIGELDEARSACLELDEIAAGFESAMLAAVAAGARGTLDLAGSDPRAALVPLREALRIWSELEVPYEAARVRVHLGLACGALGDQDSATLELEAAHSLFAELGAMTDLARVDSLLGRTDSDAAHGLTQRELEVLRLVAAGRSNKQIAAELVISEHTVARHVQNIFAKLGVSSRTAASAFAFENHLV